MKNFDEREKAFEAKFRRDQELEFRIRARRNKLLGMWAAGRLELPTGEKSEAYAMTIVAADLEEPGDEDVVRTVLAEFAAKGAHITEAELRDQLARSGAEARRQILES